MEDVESYSALLDIRSELRKLNSSSRQQERLLEDIKYLLQKSHDREVKKTNREKE